MEETKTDDKQIIEMIEAGLGFGHHASKLHPKMKPYVLKLKDGIHLINLEKTSEKLEKVLEAVKKIISEKGNILFVGTKVPHKGLIEEIALDIGMPFVKERWIGGTFTNFEQIKKRVEEFKNLEEESKTEEFIKKYNKKERLKIAKDIERMRIKFEGLKNMTSLPQAVFILDMKQDELAVKEAIDKNIPIIAIADTNVDPSLANYFVPANDDAISSVKYILDKVAEVAKTSKAVEEKK